MAINGTAVAGCESSATAIGANGFAVVRGGVATSIQDRGIAISMTGGKAEGQLLAACLSGGIAIAHDATLAIAINTKIGDWSAKAQASPGGLVILGYFIEVDKKLVVQFVPHKVTDAEGDKPLVLYPAPVDGDPPTVGLFK